MPLKMKELRNKAEDAAKTISVYAQVCKIFFCFIQVKFMLRIVLSEVKILSEVKTGLPLKVEV